MNLPLAPLHVSRLLPARAPRPLDSERLLLIDPRAQSLADSSIAELPGFFGAGDVLVVNDAATLPAALQAEPDLELRLVAAEADGSFRALTFGAGDRRLPTEARGLARRLSLGERLQFSSELDAQVVEIDAADPRLVRLRFTSMGAVFWSALYRAGQPIQYAYLTEPLALWDVQNRYAARPWAFELPSAGRPLSFNTLFALRERGAALSYVTHAAGISSTGSASLDARLPLPERYEISRSASEAIAQARASGGRVVAVGTSVVRALESSAALHGSVQPGSGSTTLRLNAASQLRVVDGLLTGMHEPGGSHFELLEALAPRSLLLRASEHAARQGYLEHEFGDACLILSR